MPLSADDLATTFAGEIDDRVAGVTTRAELVSALKVLFEAWLAGNMSTVGLAAQVANLVARTEAMFDGVGAWLTGSTTDPDSFDADGNPGGGGYYPITSLGGVTRYLPSLEFITSFADQIMATTFFASEGGALANAATFHSAWRDVGVDAGGRTTTRAFNAMVRADQSASVWIESSPDATVVNAQPGSALSSAETLPLSVPITARYYRVAVTNNSGADMTALHVETSFT